MKSTLFTIGFTKKSAEGFFSILKNAGVKKIIDVRLRPESQLSGFAKRRDLKYFLKVIDGIEYEYHEEFVTSPELLDEARRGEVTHEVAMKKYVDLIKSRELTFKAADFDGGCLLCAEPDPNHCHRKALAEYLASRLPLKIVHL